MTRKPGGFDSGLLRDAFHTPKTLLDSYCADREWARLLGAGFVFVTQVSAGEREFDADARIYQRAGFELAFAPGYDDDDPSSESRDESMVALFVKPGPTTPKQHPLRQTYSELLAELVLPVDTTPADPKTSKN